MMEQNYNQFMPFKITQAGVFLRRKIKTPGAVNGKSAFVCFIHQPTRRNYRASD